MKKSYTAPTLTPKGRVEALTHANIPLNVRLDAPFSGGSGSSTTGLTFT